MRISIPQPNSESQNASEGPFGIVDIGSNSVRLVVYAGVRRNPVVIFNDKVMAGLGRDLATTGHLHPDGVERALTALRRFRALADELAVQNLIVTATAAVREASDGPQFADEVEKVCKCKLHLIDGEEEARLAALGVLSGIPDAHGVVGDLGGGSLELISVTHGVMGEGVTLPLGPLRLETIETDEKGLQAYVEKKLAGVEWLTSMKGRSLYVVGGGWRNLARIHMAECEYPVRVLHNYEIPASEAKKLTALLERLGPQTLGKIPDISSRRISALPLSALVLSKVIESSGVEKVVVSANGLREGVLFDQLSDEEQQKDPLIAGCHDLASRLVRYTEHGDELEVWTRDLFQEVESAEEARLRHAACILADLGWFVHPDYRAGHAMDQIMLAPISGIDHRGRVFLARSGYHRHAGGKTSSLVTAKQMLSTEEAERARTLGMALRLSFTLCASRPGVLPHTTLHKVDKTLVLEVDRSHENFLGETVTKRLTQLGKSMGLPVRIDIRP